MPTQQEINAANVELQIANDNYAALANQYNRYKSALQAWADADPETREKSKGLADEVVRGLEEIRGQMYAAEDRINVAQNRVNSMNETIAAQQAQQATRRRVVARSTNGGAGNGGGGAALSNNQLRLQQYLNAGYVIGEDGFLRTPNGVLVSQNGYSVNRNGDFVPTPKVAEAPTETPTGAPTSNSLANNPYFNLYNQYAYQLAEGGDLPSVFSGINSSVDEVTNGLLAAGFSKEQTKDFLGNWLSYLQNELTRLDTPTVTPEATNVAPTVASETIKVTPVATMLVPGEGIVTIGSDGSRTVSTEGGINTFTELPSDYEEVMNTKLTPVEPYTPVVHRSVLRRANPTSSWTTRNPANAYASWATPAARSGYYNSAFSNGSYFSPRN